jgi:hypothetical protein
LPELNKSGAEGHVEWEGKEETKTVEKPKQKKKKVKEKPSDDRSVVPFSTNQSY